MAEYPALRMLGEQPLPSDPAAAAVTPPPLGPAASAEGRGQALPHGPARRDAGAEPPRGERRGEAEADGEKEEEGAARLARLRSLRLPRETRPSAWGRARRRARGGARRPRSGWALPCSASLGGLEATRGSGTAGNDARPGPAPIL